MYCFSNMLQSALSNSLLEQILMNGKSLLPILTLFLVLHSVILPYLCSNMEYSYYFQEEKNLHLFEELEELELNVENEKLHASDNSAKDQSSMVIVILTAPRARDTSYFHQTLGSVLEQVEAATQNHKVYVCSGDSMNKTTKCS